MGTGYVRNDSANNIADGNVINASDLDGEFDAIAATLATSGHTHDGTAAEGGPVTVLGPAQDFVATASVIKPKTDDTLDIGTSGLEFKDIYIDGKAYIDGFGEDTLFDTTKKIQFRDAGLYINSSGDGILDLVSDTELQVTAPTVDINASTAVLISNDLKLDSDAAVLGFGADNDVTLTHVADTGLLLNSTMALQFNDASQFINAPSATVLDVTATDEIELNATLVDINGNLDVSGTALITGIATFTDTPVFNSDVSIQDDLLLDSDAAVLSFGEDNEVTLTHVADTGLLLNSTMALQFNDASQFINAPSATVLDINATDEIELNATLVDLNGNLDVSGTALVTGVATFTATPVFSADVTIEDDLFLDSDAAVIHFGEDADVTLTHVADTGLLLNGAMQLQFNDASQYINAPSNVILDINATDEIELNATLVDVNANLDVSGTALVTGVLTANAGVVVDNFTLDGTTLALSSGDLTIDSAAGDIILDSHGNDFLFKSGATGTLLVAGDTTGGDFYMRVEPADKNLKFNGTDGSTAITALDLDMALAGYATFNSDVQSNGILKSIGSSTSTNVTSSQTHGIALQNTSDTNGNFIPIDFYNSTDFVTARIGAEFQDAGDRSTDLFFANRANGGALTETMRINSAGNVGIGTTSLASDARLTVAHPTTPHLVFERTDSSRFDAAIGMPNNGSISFYTGSDTGGAVSGLNIQMVIDSSGRVTMPSQPAFSAVNNATQLNLATGSVVGVSFQTEIFDQGADFATSTFTAPVTGRYFLSTTVRFEQMDSAANYVRLNILTSNRTYFTLLDPGQFNGDLDYWPLTNTCFADMDAGDTAVVGFEQSGGTAQSDLQNAQCHFYGYLVA